MSRRRRKLDVDMTRGSTTRAPRDDLIAWRTKRLHSVGLPHELARRLAADERYDLHALLELVDRGCPPALAVRILAPIEDADRC